MPTYFLQVWHMSMNAYTRKEQKYRADGVHVDYGYNAIHGQNYHLKGDLVLPANEEMRPGGVAMYVLLSILVLPVVVDTLYIHFSRGMRDFRQAMYATGAPSFEYTVGTFIMNILGLPMWALTSLVPQIVGNILYPNPWSTLVCGKMTRWHSMVSLTQDASSGRRRRGRTIESHRRRGWIPTTISRKGARWSSLGARSPNRPP